MVQNIIKNKEKCLNLKMISIDFRLLLLHNPFYID